MSEEFDIKIFEEVEYKEKLFDNLVMSIEKLKECINLENLSYTSNKNLIDKITLKDLFDYIGKFLPLVDKKKPTLNQLKVYMNKVVSEKLKDKQVIRGYLGEIKNNKKSGLGYYHLTKYSPEILGTFDKDNFIKGLSLYNDNKSVYYGEYNNGKSAKYQFLGLFYPDLSDNFLCIGTLNFSDFKGIKIRSYGDYYLISVETNKCMIKINSLIHDTISYYSLKTESDNSTKISFKENKYLISSCLIGDTCYFNLEDESKALVRYKVSYLQENLDNEVKLLICFPNNHVFIGHINVKSNNCFCKDGVYMIRDEGHGNFLYKIEGTWENGKIFVGQVYNAKDELIFNGEFKDNKPYYGICKFNNGEVYKGEISNYEMNGKGIYTYPSGDIFNGSFCNNIPDGKGIFTTFKNVSFELNIKDNIILSKNKLK